MLRRLHLLATLAAVYLKMRAANELDGRFAAPPLQSRRFITAFAYDRGVGPNGRIPEDWKGRWASSKYVKSSTFLVAHSKRPHSSSSTGADCLLHRVWTFA